MRRAGQVRCDWSAVIAILSCDWSAVIAILTSDWLQAALAPAAGARAEQRGGGVAAVRQHRGGGAQQQPRLPRHRHLPQRAQRVPGADPGQLLPSITISA